LLHAETQLAGGTLHNRTRAALMQTWNDEIDTEQQAAYNRAHMLITA
jgi:hypothetical protein